MVSLPDPSDRVIPASALILATSNRVFDPLSEALKDLNPMLIGDAATPRLAPYAFHKGRKVTLWL